MRLLAIFLALSFLLHILGLLTLPAFNVMAAKPLEVIPISVEMWAKPEPKTVPLSNQKNVNKKVQDQAKKDGATLDKKKDNPTPPALPAPNNDENFDFTSPFIDPALLSATESDINARLSKMLDNNTADKANVSDFNVDKAIKEQLAQTADKAKETPGTISDALGKEITAAEGNIDSNFINFDVYPANNRRLTYAPPKPEFSLPNDTVIKVKFKVDRNGNVYDIILMTRSLPQVERIAADYIKNIKFAANGNTDEAQITLTFKVRNK